MTRRSRLAPAFWVPILVQSIICLAVLFVAVWAFIALNALLHPPADFNIQLPLPGPFNE